MEENRNIEIEEEGLSFVDLLQIVKRHIISCFVFVGLFFALMMVYSFKIQTPIYIATTKVMVNPTSSTGSSINNDITYVQKIMSTYEVFIVSDRVVNTVSDEIKDIDVYGRNYKLNYTGGQIKGMIDTGVLSGSSSVSESLVLAIQVSGLNPVHCAIIANTIVEVVQELPSTSGDFEILRHSTLSLVDEAVPNAYYDKHLMRNGVIGIAIGCVVAAAYIFIREMLDTTVSDVKTLEQTLGLNVLTIVPDAEDKKSKIRV